MIRLSAALFRRSALLALLLGLLLTALASGAAPAAPPDPTPLPPNGTLWHDNIYLGAVPPDSEGKPVLLFVHGMGGTASQWWEAGNDMYLTAYNAGYRTAFVTLDFPTGEPGHSNSVWDNGETLSFQIPFIAAHYGVAQVEIIAHSKGGIDSQTAAVHLGMAPYVHKLITLGTPHLGSELADLAYADWAQWLVQLIGVQSPGLCSITTAEMAEFRALTDEHPDRNAPALCPCGRHREPPRGAGHAPPAVERCVPLALRP